MEVIKLIRSYEQLRDLVVCKLPSQETLTSKPVIVAIGLTDASVSTYAWYRYKFNHWKSRGIDSPAPSFPFGNGVDKKDIYHFQRVARKVWINLYHLHMDVVWSSVMLNF